MATGVHEESSQNRLNIEYICPAIYNELLFYGNGRKGESVHILY